MSGPDYLVANLVEQPQRHRRFIHLVNFNVKNVPSIENVEISCVGPKGKAVHSVRMYSPESEAGKDLSFKVNSGNVFFTVPYFNAYCMIEVS